MFIFCIAAELYILCAFYRKLLKWNHDDDDDDDDDDDIIDIYSFSVSFNQGGLVSYKK